MRKPAVIIALLLGLCIGAAEARVLAVGPGQAYALPSEAAAVARDGDTVEIAAGDYFGDAAVWRASGLTPRGQGRAAENFTLLSYGVEQPPHLENALRVEGNTFINDRKAGCRLIFVKPILDAALVSGNRFLPRGAAAATAPEKD